MLIFTIALAAATPTSFTDTHQRDIGCVAVIGIIAHEQREGGEVLKTYPDVRETGKRWAGIVGARVTEETGQPRELVAFAIKQAVEDEQTGAAASKDPAAYVSERFDQCYFVMTDQLAAADAATPAVPADDSPSMLAPEAADWGTDEPVKIAQYGRELGEDLSSAHRIRFCRTMIGNAHKEIVGREGPDSRDAKTFARLVSGFDFKMKSLPKGDKPKPVTADELNAELAKQPTPEEQMARCIRLGESLALALPPE